jgi:hypothetical protein
MKPPRKNRISGQWSPRPIGMLESPAYRALSLSAHRIMSRIEIELARHGGKDNGRLAVPIPGEAARRSGMMPPTDSEMISPAVPR